MEEQSHFEFELIVIMGPLERNEVDGLSSWKRSDMDLAVSNHCIYWNFHDLITMHTMTLNCYLVEILIIPLEVCHLLIKASDPLLLFDLADASYLCCLW